MRPWWRVLGLDGPTTDPDVIEAAYEEIHPTVSVIWTNDTEAAAELEWALEEGARYCLERR